MQIPKFFINITCLQYPREKCISTAFSVWCWRETDLCTVCKASQMNTVFPEVIPLGRSSHKWDGRSILDAVTPNGHILSKYAPVLFITSSENYCVPLLFFMVMCSYSLPYFYFMLTVAVLLHSRKMTSSFLLHMHHLQDSHETVQ